MQPVSLLEELTISCRNVFWMLSLTLPLWSPKDFVSTNSRAIACCPRSLLVDEYSVCPLLVADSMQNSVCFADEGPKGTSKEILPLWFLLLGERKASLPWENQTLPKGRGSADHLHQKPHLSANALLPAWPTLQVALNKILSEPASLTTQSAVADFLWIFMGLKLYQTLLHFGNKKAAAGIAFTSR